MNEIDSDLHGERSAPATESDWRRGSELSRSLAAAAARVDDLIRDAQTIAEQIYGDAERDAERHLAERRRQADLLLLEQRSLIRDVFETLRRDLDAAERRAADAVDEGMRRIAIDGSRAAPADPLPPEPPTRPTAVADPATPGSGEHDRGEQRQSRAQALIRAGQLAAIGHDRAQIEAALRSELGYERPAEVVDEILPG